MICMRHCHCKLDVLIRNRTIRADVDVIYNVTPWLSGILCYHGYRPAVLSCDGAADIDQSIIDRSSGFSQQNRYFL